MNKFLVVCCIACFAIGFFLGRSFSKEKIITKNVQGVTIRDTITRFVPDTVYLAGELKYKYVYVPDTIYQDVPVVDRDATIAATVKDWNLNREYRRTLFDNENGKLSVGLAVQYNELQNLSYSFTPMHKETTIVKKRMLKPFVSASFHTDNTFSVGGGFFVHNLGFRVEWAFAGLDFGVIHKF